MPKPDEQTKRAQAGGGSKLSRIDRLKRDRIVPPLPANPAPAIVDRLVEIGLTEAAGMGIVPLSWREIEAWQCNSAIALPPWEARLIRRLSVDYVAQSRRSESENCPPPWSTAVTAREIETEEARLRAVLG